MRLQRGMTGARFDVRPEVLTWDDGRLCLWMDHMGDERNSHTSLEMTRMEAAELIRVLARALAFTAEGDEA